MVKHVFVEIYYIFKLNLDDYNFATQLLNIALIIDFLD